MEIKEAVVLFERILREDSLDYSLSDIQEIVLCQSILGLSYQEIADRYGYDHDYIKQIGAQLWRSLSQALNQKVTKSNISRVLRQYNPVELNQSPVPPLTKRVRSLQDWGDAIDVRDFVGRESEFNRCRNWIVEDRCRLLTILGMGGVGKTAIASKLARDIASEFEFVIWRSLRNAPPFRELLGDLILFASRQQEVNLTDDLDIGMDCLMRYLSSSRCLLILDNVESILRSREIGGHYRAGYEGYGQLLRRVADEAHQSCLILTSREQPVAIGRRESSLVRSLQLSGLSVKAGQEILQATHISNSQKLVEQYQGNPLALKIAATTIKYLFAGDVEEFLTSGIKVFGDIWDLLEQQFNRLATQEQAVMYWLAINRELVSLNQLRQDLVPAISARNLIEVLESLQRRSLIEASISGFTQQAVVMEYTTERLINLWETEIKTGKINLLKTHPIIKADAKDYLRETQIRLILRPLLEKLLVNLKEQHEIEQRLQAILEYLRSFKDLKTQYVVGNLINLLKYLQVDLTGWNFSQLQVWQADFRGMSLQEVDFTDADLSKSIFTEKMGSIFAVEFSPDGKLLATGNDHQINIWQIPEYRLIMTLPGHDAPPIWTLTFSPDSQMLASGSSDRTVRLWDVASGQCLKILSGHQGSILSLAFSPDGLTLVSSSEDNSLKVWQIESGQEIAKLPSINSHIVDALAFSPDGDLIASVNQIDGIRIWQLSTNSCLQTISIEAGRDIPLAFSPDGQCLAVGLTKGTIKLWNIMHQAWQKSLVGHSARLTDLEFSKDGKTLVSSSVDGTIRLWQLSVGRCMRVLRGHQSRVSSISIASDNQTLASGSEDGSVRIWDSQAGQC